jgi:hypothetical protein
MSVFTPDIEGGNVNPVNIAPTTSQGSTTSGTFGNLTLGATTTAAPTYTTLTSNPLSLDTSGNLRVSLASSNVNVLGTLTNNNAVPAANNLGVLSARANAAAPTWTEGFQVLLSEDLSGNLRVITGTGSTTAVTGNVTVVQPTGTNLHTVVDSGTITVTQATGTNLHAVIDNFPADADALAQGSTTSGQLGALVMGAVTTASPTYTTATTNPLSIDTTGNLRVVVSNPSTSNKATAATITRVATSTTAATVLTANASRKKFVIRTETGTHTYVAYGSTATSTNYTYDLGSDATLEETVWTGSVSVVRLSGTGSIQVTDLV